MQESKPQNTTKKPAAKKSAKKSAKKRAASSVSYPPHSSIANSPELDALSDRHRLFVLEYLKNGMNATAAYKSVYPKSNLESARREGSRLLTNVDISKAVRAELDMIIGSDKLMIEKLVWQNIREILSANLADYIDDDAQVDVGSIRTKNPGAVVSVKKEIYQSDNGTTIKSSVRLDDRAKAREHALKLLGLMKEDSASQPIIILPIHEVVEDV